jgi:transposase
MTGLGEQSCQAICAAVTRPTMRFVPVEEVDQQDLRAFHYARERPKEVGTSDCGTFHTMRGAYQP